MVALLVLACVVSCTTTLYVPHNGIQHGGDEMGVPLRLAPQPAVRVFVQCFANDDEGASAQLCDKIEDLLGQYHYEVVDRKEADWVVDVKSVPTGEDSSDWGRVRALASYYVLPYWSIETFQVTVAVSDAKGGLVTQRHMDFALHHRHGPFYRGLFILTNWLRTEPNRLAEEPSMRQMSRDFYGTVLGAVAQAEAYVQGRSSFHSGAFPP